MSSQDGERTEAQTIPFPEGESKAKQQPRPGENQETQQAYSSYEDFSPLENLTEKVKENDVIS